MTKRATPSATRPLRPHFRPLRDVYEVPLTKGKVALIDGDDFLLVSRYKWRARLEDGNWYAVSGRNAEIKMHRLISGALPGEKVDHWDGDGLNNRRGNLRHCTNTQNARNQRPHSDKRTSKYKGVALLKDRGKFRAQIMVDRKKINLGTFADEPDAARAYDAAAMKYFGEFARLNFPVRDKTDKEVL